MKAILIWGEMFIRRLISQSNLVDVFFGFRVFITVSLCIYGLCVHLLEY